MKGKTQMKGWLLVNSKGTSNQKDFDFWMKIAVEYNKKARTADKRKKKINCDFYGNIYFNFKRH